MDGSSTPPVTAPPSRQRLTRAIWLVAPLVVWLAVVAVNSTDLASSARTDELLLRFLSLFMSGEGGPDSGGFDALSWAVRKAAHVVEYAVLALLLARLVRGLLPRYVRDDGRRAAPGKAVGVAPGAADGAAPGAASGAAAGTGIDLLWRTAVAVVPFGLAVSVLDELHQVFVVSRSGSAGDIVFDFIGLMAGVVAAWLYWRRRARRRRTSPPE